MINDDEVRQIEDASIDTDMQYMILKLCID